MVLPPNSPTEVLGAAIGDADAAAVQFQAAVSKAVAAHEAIHLVGDAGTELVLLRKCADIGKVMFQLRTCGDMLPVDLLEQFDKSMRAALERLL
eukprot:6761919-Karenia_brevis.AAC.1